MAPRFPNLNWHGLLQRLAAAAPWTWAPERRRLAARSGLRRAGIALAALLAIWLVLWLAVPPLLKSQAQQRLGTLLGRTVTIGVVQFAPWSLELTLRDVTIAGAAAGATPLLQVQRLYANADWRSLFRLAPVIAALEIDAPRVSLARTAPGRYDIDDIVARLEPSPQAQAEPAPPARFALYNLLVRDGALAFDDRPVGRRHEVDALLLSLPFVSTLPSQAEITVQPRLAFRFDGTAFDTGAQATPFAKDRETSMTLKMGDFDLAIARPYLPRELPVQLQRGRAQADLSLHFELREGSTPSVSLRGKVSVSDLALTDRAGAPLAAWRGLQVGLDDVQPLVHRAALGSVRFDGLDVALTRDASGRINVLQLASPRAAQADAPDRAVLAAAGGAAAATAASAAASATASAAANAAAGAASSEAPAARAAPADAAWQLSLRSLELAQARVRWSDAAPAAALSFEGIDAKVESITWPATQPATLALTAQLHAHEAAAGTLELHGSATPQQASAALRAADIDLGAFAPYVAQHLVPQVAGRLSFDGKAQWAAAPAALAIELASASVDALRVVDPRQAVRPRERKDKAREAVAWKQFALGNVRLDAVARRVDVGTVALHDARFVLERERDGTLAPLRWLRAPAAGEGAAAPQAARGNAAAAPTWQVALDDVAVTGSQVSWRDEAAPGGADDPPVQLDVHAIRAHLSGLHWPVAAAPAQVELSAQVADPAAQREQRRARGGSIDWKGRVVAQPLDVRGALRIERFPVHALGRYATGRLNASLQRGQLRWRGEVALRERRAGIEAHVAGNLLLADLHVFGLDPVTHAVAPDELIGWQALDVKGLKVALAPPARPRVDIGEAVLSDFYSQLVLSADGRFNLREVARGDAPAAPSGGFAVGPQIAPAGEAARAEVAKPEAARPAAGEAVAAPAAAASAPAAAASAAAAPLPLDIAVGGLQLVNGRVDYTDHLIKPNYSAALSDLNGRLGAFDSRTREMATLELDGRIAGTGKLEVRGSLNPLADPLALDIGAKATDLELAPLSPYAGKYAGYAIERGKLSMDVHYTVQPDGRLEARNHVILNQLTFGEHIDSPSATKLPVRLAVALLSDRNGVIDVNLPISGSINDPQFSVGGIIVKVIVNLIVKVITAPFSWLAGGGGADSGDVLFRPGTAVMAAGAEATLAKVAKALQERPSLQTTVTGEADARSEGDAMRAAMLEQRLLTQRRNDALRSGAAASAPGDVPPDERARLVREVYREADLPDKPRNFLGFAKDIPVPEMEALLKKHLRVDEDSARQLALQRALAVRDALVAQGLPSARLFVAAPKLHAASGAEAWKPRVQLALAVK